MAYLRKVWPETCSAHPCQQSVSKSLWSKEHIEIAKYCDSHAVMAHSSLERAEQRELAQETKQRAESER